MFVENGLKKDPDNSGRVLGWGVVRSAPWHLAGVYGSKEAAEMKAAELGDGHEAKYGSHHLGSDDFVSGITSE